jgi:hypothetical protein
MIAMGNSFFWLAEIKKKFSSEPNELLEKSCYHKCNISFNFYVTFLWQ